MTTEPGQNGEPRRKFDDVASLFGNAAPGAGAASRFPPHRPAFIPMPPTYTAPIKRPEAQEPDLDADPDDDIADNVHITTVPAATGIQPTSIPLRLDPPPIARPRPTEIPWPDAFEPRPNYRKSEGKNWSWLLLIPAGLVAAAAFTLVDARSARSWIDRTILNRTPVAGALDSPLLPQAFRPAPAGTAAATPPVEEPIRYPAIPTSPVPMPPGTEASPPPPDPAEVAAAAAAPIRVNIQFRRNIPGADGEARRIAALLQSYGGSIELHPTTTTVKVATINYYNAADKDAAAALATVLANEAASWIVRLSPTKNPLGTLDVLLP